MFKIIAGIAFGIFLGAVMTEIIKHRLPKLVEGVESHARTFTDRIFGPPLEGDGQPHAE